MIQKLNILFFFSFFLSALKLEASPVVGSFQGQSAYTNFAWSSPVDNLCFGVKQIDSQTLNGQPANIIICLLNATNSDKPKLSWIAPPQFQRTEFFLYNKSGKVVPYLSKYDPSNKIYKTLSEVPKNSHNVHIGYIFTRSDLLTVYDHIDLTNIFQINQSGNYKLVVKGRILKINDDFSLSVVRFSPIPLMIHLGDRDIGDKSN